MPEDRARIVEFWRAVEIFSPQQLPKPDARARITDLGPGESMPWEPGSRLHSKPTAPDKTWRHEVFGGVYELSRVRDTLVGLYEQNDPTGDGQREPVSGQSALFACTVDADGLLVEGSAVLSACAWAIGRAVAERGKLTLAGFDQEALRYGDDLGKLAGSPVAAAGRLLAASVRAAVPDAVAGGVKAAVAGALTPVAGPVAAAGAALAGGAAGRLAEAAMVSIPQHGQPTEQEPPPARLDLHPLVGSDLQRFVAELAARLGVTDMLIPRRVRVRSYQVSAARTEDETEQNFLNSLYADDLARIGKALAAGNVGASLSTYLTSAAQINNDRRIDVRRQRAAVWNGCVPSRIPAGRWVTDTDRSLALSQQFAVNEIMKGLARAPGLFPVNGPPGTGKTTMLRDLIAAIIVERATCLANLPNTAAAFDLTRPYRWQPGKIAHWITPLVPELTGLEIVVASSNNGAVENVTTEIPGPEGVGTQWRRAAAEVDYFTSTARLVHGEGAWAMIAAKLGNRANRHAFAQSFWWGAPGRQDGCMVDLLERLQDRPPDWSAARSKFRAALDKVSALSAERARAALSIARVPSLKHDAQRAFAAITAADAELRTLEAQRPAAEDRLRDADMRHRAASDALENHWCGKPGLIISLSTRFRAGREWYAEHATLSEAHRDAERKLNAAQHEASAMESRIAHARQARTKAVNTLDRLTAEFKQERDRIDEARRL